MPAMLQVLFAQNEPQGSPLPLFAMVGIAILFYLVVILPAGRRERKQQQAMLAGLKRGMRVVTTSGIIGIVIGVKDNEDEITIRSEDSKLKVLKSTVLRVVGSDEAEAAK